MAHSRCGSALQMFSLILNPILIDCFQMYDLLGRKPCQREKYFFDTRTRINNDFVVMCYSIDRKNVTDFLYLVLHLACKVICYFRLFSSVLVGLSTQNQLYINVLLKSKSKNYVTWIANLTKLFLSVRVSRQSPPLFDINFVYSEFWKFG